MHPDPGLLFDAEWYLARNPDVMAAGQDPLEHYIAHGGREDRSPHPLFDAGWYRAQNPDVAPDEAPLTHYLKKGGAADPHPLFDTGWYLSQNLDAAVQIPLLHYLANPNASDPHPLFDTRWYLAQNPDVAARRLNPLAHFLSAGAWRDPHPLFDVGFYLSRNPDVAAAGVNPLLHYMAHGAGEGREASTKFHPAWYRSIYPDIADSNPLLHYVRHGRTEGRSPLPQRRNHPPRSTAKLVLAHRGDGIGTRLLTILHARMLAEAVGFELRVAWPGEKLPYHENENLLRNAGQDIFQGNFIFEGAAHLRGDFLDLDAIGGRHLSLSNVDGQMRALHTAAFQRAIEEFDVLLYESPFLLARCVKQQVHVPHEIRRLWRSIAWHPAISERGASICKTFPIEDCIAVHVRRGDVVNMLTRAQAAYLTPERMEQIFHRYAPVQAYFENIDAVRGGEKILVCSDDTAIHALFQARYGSAIIPANILDGLADGQRAVMDLILLSRAKVLIAPFISLFSRCAAEVGEVRYRPMALDPSAIGADLLKIAERAPQDRRALIQALIREAQATLKYSARYGDG